MATKFKQILDSAPRDAILFSNWLTAQGLDIKAQYAYTKSGWLERMVKGVYKFKGSTPSLLSAVSSYNTQLEKKCIIGAYSALDIAGVSHYVAMGKPQMYLFTDNIHRLPVWMLDMEWDYTVVYNTTSFLGDNMLGVEQITVAGKSILVSSRERAILECLYLPKAARSLLDIYYIMESLTSLRPDLLQDLLERCKSVKAKRLFLYMSEKANYPWFHSLDVSRINLGTGRRMIVPTGKYIRKYNMTIPTELAEYE